MSTQGILGDFGRLFFCPQFNQHHGTYMGAGLLAIAECQSMHSLMTHRNRGQARTPMNCTRLESGGIKKRCDPRGSHLFYGQRAISCPAPWMPARTTRPTGLRSPAGSTPRPSGWSSLCRFAGRSYWQPWCRQHRTTARALSTPAG